MIGQVRLNPLINLSPMGLDAPKCKQFADRYRYRFLSISAASGLFEMLVSALRIGQRAGVRIQVAAGIGHDFVQEPLAQFVK